MNPVYDNGVEWDEAFAAEDFRRRLAARQAEGLEVSEATMEEFLRAREQQLCPSS